MKRIVLLLAVALVLSLMSVGVLAAEQASPGAVNHEQIPFQVNPLYEGLIDPADFVSEQEEKTEGENTLSHTQSAFNGTKATYVSAEKAAKQLREQMKKRAERVELYIYNETSNYKALISDVMMQATAHTGDPEEGDYLLWHYAGWSGEVYSDLVNKRYEFHFILDMEYYTSAEQEKALDTAVKELINSLNLKGKSDYEKVCAVYDYICQNITYDYANLNDGSYTLKYSAYAALINKTAVCQGYANLLYRVLLELGIDNRIITGETLEGPHAWNIIKLGDVYYNADATWDAVPGEHVYFLKNSEGFWDHVRYLDYMTTQFHTDYPMSATDYVDGVAGEPEHIFVWGICGEDAYWTIDRDGVLTIFGTGATQDFRQNNRPGPWSEWSDGFDKVVVEEGITRLGTFTFYRQDNIVSVQLPESLMEVGGNAFRSTSLTHIRIPGSLKVLEHCIFQYCNQLVSVELEAGLEEIGHGAFDGCTALKSIEIPETVKNISSTAFDQCQSLTEITIPASVEHLYGFRGCTGLETVHIYGANVGTWAFQHCTNLKNVVLYDTVKQVGTNAFEGCVALETITVPASVTYFGMESCSGLKTIYFQGNAPEMPYNAFRGTTATAYYPADNPTWTEDIMQNYEGNITWVPYTPGEQPAGVLGDVSGDGILDSYDATLILQYDVGMISGETIQLQLADVSGDGIVDSYDATLILQYDVGMLPALPAA